MSELDALVATRLQLQRVATHVLARRRHDVCGRFGLRATPGGIGTPAFGPPDLLEVVRIDGTDLVHERGDRVAVRPIDGATLAELAGGVGVDLTRAFDVGRDTPPVGEADEPLRLDEAAASRLAAWFDLGWRALDAVALVARDPAPAQLWPEHFDASSLVSIGDGEADRCDLGLSSGDRFSDAPYLYVGPWTEDRPGDPAYWNVGFGAQRSWDDVSSVGDAVEFWNEGLSRFRPTST
ncbi:MAG: hypothetical protein ACJ739_07040 [Acidimicrobiales bacterium]